MAEKPWNEEPEVTAQPSERAIGEADDEKTVPMANVGGAAPTARGLDSGGNMPGPEDDLGNLYVDEPETAPEVGAVSIREDDEENP